MKIDEGCNTVKNILRTLPLMHCWIWTLFIAECKRIARLHPVQNVSCNTIVPHIHSSRRWSTWSVVTAVVRFSTQPM